MLNGKAAPKILTILGTVLVWIPILFTVLTSVVGTVLGGQMRFDYLMPAELFLFALGGAVLLLCASLWTRIYRKSVIIGGAAACFFLLGGQGFAIASGLASGAAAPGGWAWITVIASIAVYSLAVVELGVVGIMLSVKLFSARGKKN